MASTTYDPSVSGTSLIVVFQLGICITLLATVANGTQGYGTLTGSAGYLIGGAKQPAHCWSLSSDAASNRSFIGVCLYCIHHTLTERSPGEEYNRPQFRRRPATWP